MSDVTLLDIPVWLLSNALEDPAFDLALMCLLTCLKTPSPCGTLTVYM